MKKLILILFLFSGCTKVCIKEDTQEMLNSLQQQANYTGEVVVSCLQDENCYQVTYIFYPKIKSINILKNQTD
jgi:hypothetical protein